MRLHLEANKEGWVIWQAGWRHPVPLGQVQLGFSVQPLAQGGCGDGFPWECCLGAIGYFSESAEVPSSIAAAGTDPKPGSSPSPDSASFLS